MFPGICYFMYELVLTSLCSTYMLNISSARLHPYPAYLYETINNVQTLNHLLDYFHYVLIPLGVFLSDLKSIGIKVKRF